VLYASYGMNTNVSQMAYRCPDAVSIGRVDITGYSLVFRGVADIEEDSTGVLQAVLWDITDRCEQALDILEGYPDFYDKKYIDVIIGNKTYRTMIYQMTDDCTGDYYPPKEYYQTMLEDGYEDHGLDLNQIYQAKGFHDIGAIDSQYVY